MAAGTENTRSIAEAQAYRTELFRELITENGTPTLRTQNQCVDFILADPELCRAAARWARTAAIGEASTDPPRQLPDAAAYRRILDPLQGMMERRNFSRQRPDSR